MTRRLVISQVTKQSDDSKDRHRHAPCPSPVVTMASVIRNVVKKWFARPVR
jgi:hypothetical protein